MTELDEAKADLLRRAAALTEKDAERDGLDAEQVAKILRRYFRHVAPEDLLVREPSHLYGAAIDNYRLAVRRPQGTASVRVFTPTLEEHGWCCGHTVVEVVTDDMPFIVDSVTMELSRLGRGIHIVVHPQMIVRRDITGVLEEVVDSSDPAKAPDGAIVESWLHVEIDRETDPAALDELRDNLVRILRDVREAVEDWQKMRGAALRIAESLASEPPAGVADEEVAEAWELLRWLADDHYTFLGYREYVLDVESGEDVLRAVPGTGLGILRSDQVHSTSFSQLPPQVRAKAREKRLLTLTKANSRATVHRPTYLDYIGVKTFDERGEVVGERRFLGLYASSAYTESVSRIPVLRRKLHDTLDRSGFPPLSHSGKDLAQIIETYPRDELFQISVDDLLPTAMGVMHLQERRRLRLFVRRDDYGRFMSCLVYLPRDRYTTEVRVRMSDILKESFGAESVDYTARVSESVLARLHFVARMSPGALLPDQVDVAEIERRLVEATRSWQDDFVEALVDQVGEEHADRLQKRYDDAFPEAYKEDFSAATAVADIKHLEVCEDDGELGMNLYQPADRSPQEWRFKLYRVGAAISLSQVLPLLQRMGVEVADERPYAIERKDGVTAWVYDFGLRYRGEPVGSVSEIKNRFQNAFSAVWRGDAESDGFNALVLRAGLAWREVMVLRAYAKYLRQGGTTFSQEYIEECLDSNVDITRLLVQLFEARLSPDLGDAREALTESLVEKIKGALDRVEVLDQDRILRSFLTLIRATLRTNYFQRAGGRFKPTLAIKLDPQSVPDLPKPRPRFEIWVYSPRLEGVHLRFGAVARGGLRWSDRREDFRTEILGLVKAQMVKNAVIVPVGAKGGFVVKRPPLDPTDREALLAEGVACYEAFISAMLDITDNLVGGQVVPPPSVVRHDGDDTYLVVAADKGTASFSDLANRVATAYGFWLGDAFASGGSVGYDHKAMGITARGAWESVRRHFREMGVDTQSQDFTVVGIGDMSGDVFGNGMLLSRHIRLVAAFDHRHIFLDPAPDAERSWHERKRLFDMPRSSWADYDPSLISPGGGVYSRKTKTIAITPEVRRALGLDEGVQAMTPPELLRAILTAPVDLLWNGGIGTYVKASTETHADVGDKSNDAIRANGSELRVKVVGEGGNLGLTQLGRIEYALSGGRLNTDFIDNSAGVDTSDHEVNIKILLDRVVEDGGLVIEERNALLAEMTDEVAALVLRDNYGQNVALATALAQAPQLLHVHIRHIRRLEREGELDRALEFLPSERQLTERRQAGQGLTGPELAVLLAYSKNTLTEEILETDLVDDPHLRAELYRYFPSALQERFRDRIDAHPLRRQIIATDVVNSVLNNAGITFVFRLKEETGASADEITRAYLVSREVFDVQGFWEAVDALDARVVSTVQTQMRLDMRRLVERGARWLLHNRRSPLDVTSTIEAFREGATAMLAALPKLLRGADLASMHARHDGLVAAGVPEELAVRVACADAAYSAFDVVEVARDSGRDVIDVAEVYFDLSDRLQIARLLTRINALPRDDRWKSMARAALRDDLYAAHAALTFDVLAASIESATSDDRYLVWEQRNAVAVARARQTLDEIAQADTSDLATLSVALRVMRTLLRPGVMA